MVYELQSSRLPVQRHAAELVLYRELVAEMRRGGYLPRRVRLALERIPKLTDREAWNRLTAEERQDAANEEVPLGRQPGED